MKPFLRNHARAIVVIGAAVVLAAAGTRLGDARGPSMQLAAGGLLYGGVILALLIPAGSISEPLRSGAALFWLQKPIPHLRWLGARFAVAALTGMILAVALGLLVAVVAGAGRPGVPGLMLKMLAPILLTSALLQSILFAMSSWRVPRDLTATLLVSAGLVAAQVLATLAPTEVGSAAGFLRAVAFPMEPVGALLSLLGGGRFADVAAELAHVTAWMAFWILLGVAGLAHAVRHPLPADTSA